MHNSENNIAAVEVEGQVLSVNDGRLDPSLSLVVENKHSNGEDGAMSKTRDKEGTKHLQNIHEPVCSANCDVGCNGDDISGPSPGEDGTLVNISAKPQQSFADDDWRFCSTDFIGPMGHPETVKPKADIEDKLDEFYKELAELEPSEDSAEQAHSDAQAELPVKNLTVEHKESHNKKNRSPYHRPHPYQTPAGTYWHSSRSQKSLSDGPRWGPPCYPPHLLQDRPHMGTQPLPVPVPQFYGTIGGPVVNMCCESFPLTPDGYSDHLPYGAGPPPIVTDGFSYEDPFAWRRYGQVCGLPSRQYPPHISQCSGSSGSSRVLILMRGLPGSGKSTLARELLGSGTNGLVLSTDDYFCQVSGYTYDRNLLSDAHDWNQERARAAMDGGRSPVIIDNTNMQAWEMKPYTQLALEKGYHVDFCEPNTSWKMDPVELERRNKHGVPRQKIFQMLERFERPMTVDVVMKSQKPSHQRAEQSPAGHRRRH